MLILRNPRTGNLRDPVQTGLEMQIHRPTERPPRGAVGSIYDVSAPRKSMATDGGNHLVLRAEFRSGYRIFAAAISAAWPCAATERARRIVIRDLTIDGGAGKPNEGVSLSGLANTPS